MGIEVVVAQLYTLLYTMCDLPVNRYHIPSIFTTLNAHFNAVCSFNPFFISIAIFYIIAYKNVWLFQIFQDFRRYCVLISDKLKLYKKYI